MVGGKRCVVGGAEEIRTPDPLLAKEVLSQLSYGPGWTVCRPASGRGRRWWAVAPASRLLLGWWAMVDSNHRPRSYQDRALTI